MNKKLIVLLAAFGLLFSCKDKYSDLKDGLYAEIKTSKGDIILELAFEKTPVTVANFVSLAEGKNTFVTEAMKGKPFYDGLKFHRVLQNFMIQGGDPLGTGSGDTGYKFKDEITDLRHDKPGILSMANSGPGTNSSQFFITHLETPWLDGKHTVFGHVIKGMETVNKIVQDDKIISVKIIRKGSNAKKFDAVKTFDNYFRTEAENQKKQAALDAQKNEAYRQQYKEVIDKKLAFFDQSRKNAVKTPSGLSYTITEKGKGKKPVPGTPVYIHYAGFLEDGTLFDSSIVSVAKQFGKYDENREAQGGYSPIPFEAGRKDGMIPGFLEGLDKLSFGDKAIIFIPTNLGYGPAGAGGIIPPNANLIFEVQLLEKPN